MRLFRGRGFSAAAATTFIVGMALFGSMLLLPLYFQVARGESPLHAGLLVAPQGLGAAFAMRFSGRMTDRVGGGRVVLIGLTILTAGDDPLRAHRGRHALLAAGASASSPAASGLGFTMMPAMAAAYATLEHQQVPRATPMLNVVQRVGGSIGTACSPSSCSASSSGPSPAAAGRWATCSPRRPTRAERLAEPLATAFAHTYWWALALTAVAFVPATVLAVTEGRERRARAAAGGPDATRARAPQATPIAG